MHAWDSLILGPSRVFPGVRQGEDKTIPQDKRLGGFEGTFRDPAAQLVLVVKNSPANVGDIRVEGSVPGLGRSPGGGHGTCREPA